ncbi:MAG: hypothetical protein ACE5NM_10825 [Sedimentisphaerales bacterium]
MSRNLWASAFAIACCLAGLWLLSTTGGTQGSQKTYEVQPYITVPEYRTDAARAIDAYERLMERYMDLTEKNLFIVGTDIREVTKKLDSIDDKLTQLSATIARIEKALGIEPAPASPDARRGSGQSNLSVKKKPPSPSEGQDQLNSVSVTQKPSPLATD